MSDTNYTLMFAMEFELPSFSPNSLSPTGMKEDIDGLFTYREYALTLKSRVKQLEQQLSNSVSKDDLNKLVEELRAIENRNNNPRDQHLVGASLGAGMAADKLNKLIKEKI